MSYDPIFKVMALNLRVSVLCWVLGLDLGVENLSFHCLIFAGQENHGLSYDRSCCDVDSCKRDSQIYVVKDS